VTRSLRNRAAIAGIGQTEFSKASGRSELQLACESVKAALDDAGLRPAEVDGLVTFTMDSSERPRSHATSAFRISRCSHAFRTAAVRRRPW
jgi:3-oxoacyl-[acyl-carrier-protein] synthase III